MEIGPLLPKLWKKNQSGLLFFSETRYEVFTRDHAAAVDFTVYVVITDIMVIILCDGWTNGG